VAYTLSSRSSWRVRVVIRSRNKARSAWYRAAGRFDFRPCMMMLPDESATRQCHPRPRFESTMSNITYLNCDRSERFTYVG
jgi:hypothetical protein